MRGQRHAPAALYPRERPGIHCTGGWVGPRAGLDRCGKYRSPHRGFDPQTVQPVASRYADWAIAAPQQLFLPHCLNDSWIFVYRSSKNTQMSNFMKIHPLGAELFHAGSGADGKTVIIAFRNLKIRGLHPSRTWRHWGCYASQHGVMPQKIGIFIGAAARTLLLAQQFYGHYERRACGGSKQEWERKLQPEQGANNCGGDGQCIVRNRSVLLYRTYRNYIR